MAANGVEDFRQESPPNAVAVATMLLDAGAEVDAWPTPTAVGPIVRARAGEDRVIADPWRGDVTDPEALALVWAARYGHPAVLEFLLDRGVPATAADDMTALHWAAAHGHISLIELLLARGAPLEALNAYGGTVLGSTLWVVDNAPLPGVDYRRVMRRLVDAGACTDVHPAMQRRVDEAIARP